MAVKKASEPDIKPKGSEPVLGLARAVLANAITQLAVHFPSELSNLELSASEALERALVLAEEAIVLAPNLPDGYATLGRLLLCHEDKQALKDAVEVLRHALTLDAEHDPAEITLATALRELGQSGEALEHVERVLHRGNGLAQPLVLRALILMDAGKLVEARRDLERALRIAPDAGVFLLDAARAAEADGDKTAADEYRERAQKLLGNEFLERDLAVNSKTRPG